MTKQPTNKLISNDFVKSVARAFAFDLLRYSENGGNMQDITANKVYAFLEQLDEQNN